jgi:uncharacterized repeat protein (TIGR01451 family)
MFKLNKIKMRAGLLVLAVIAMILGISLAPIPVLAATSPSLGAALTYSVLAGSAVTDTGSSTMNADLGISPGIGDLPHYSGIIATQVGPPGTIHDADAHAALAQAANTSIFGDLAQTPTVDYGAVVKDLSEEVSLGPGVYHANAFLVTGNLTLTGSGVWIFESEATLTTSADSSVFGSDPCNVWWRVASSATLGTNSHMIGNILALTSIHLKTGAILNGRAMTQTAEITLDNSTITTLLCGLVTGPHLSLIKSVSPATFRNVGDVLTYTLFATNDGNVDLDVSISDLDPGFTITGPPPPSTLIPGATMTVTGTHIITPADLANGSFKNTANASGITGPGATVTATPATQESFRAPSVGGEVSGINKADILAPWLGLGLVLVLGGTILTVLLLRRRTSR